MRPIIPYKEESTKDNLRHRSQYPRLFLEINGVVVRMAAVHFADLKKKQMSFKKLAEKVCNDKPMIFESYEIYYTILSKMDTKAVREKCI
jgi:hypothetical protein